MVRFGLTIYNPIATKFRWRCVRCWEEMIPFLRHKAYCIQIDHQNPDNVFSLDIDVRFRGEDHAGPKVALEFMGWSLDAKIYDTRHWNFDAGRWMTEFEMAHQFDEDGK